MKSHTTTILANALIALTKVISAYAMIQLPEARPRAFVPITAAILLIVACGLISRHRWHGALLALLVTGFFLLQFVLLGAISSMFGYFVLHALSFAANFASFRVLRQQPSNANQPPIA